MNPTRVDLLPPLPLGVYASPPAQRLPFPLEEDACRLYSRARHGLREGVPALGLSPGDEVLVPAYHHGSEVEALLRAGLTCRFYDVPETLAPDEAELEALVNRKTRALYLIHYLGFPQDAAHWRGWCDERGLLLLEDAAQAWLGSIGDRPLGSFGHLSIFCLYKTFGLPDGAAMLSVAPPPAPSGRPRPGLARLARRHGRWLAARSGLVAKVAASRPRRSRYEPGRDFALGDPNSRPAAASAFLLPRVGGADAAARRRDNYRCLLGELSEWVPPALASLPDGSSPHAFPLATGRREQFVARLAEAGVRAFSFWSFPHPSLPGDGYPGAASWRSRLVALPVHQELRRADVVRVAAAARAAQPLALEPSAGARA